MVADDHYLLSPDIRELAVNGLPLRGFSDSRAAHKKLKNEDRFALSVIRGEEELVLVYEFRPAEPSKA